MNITRSQLKQQLDRVVANGWWAHLEEAARQHFPDGPFDAADLFGIGSRESNFNPVWLTKPGDHGNGFGLMQIDHRYFPTWVARGLWKDPREGILKGAEVLRLKYDEADRQQGRPISATTRAGRTYSLSRAAVLDSKTHREVAVAAYNSGAWAHYHVTKGRSPDHGTTGKDYSADVLERALVARGMVPAAGASKPCPTCKGRGTVPA